MRFLRSALLFLALLATLTGTASASFHLMQIEQVIGGVGGDPTAQAIQLRMRANFEGLVHQARLVVRDATGNNPILVLDLTSDVVNDGLGSRILIASPAFAARLSPSVIPDFTIANLIPPSYLAAGSLTWESDPPIGTVYWRLSWGGSGYTGTGACSTLNGSGNFNPPFSGPLPSSGTQAVLFRFAASALGTNNANDYQLTPGAAVFTNNSAVSGTVTLPPVCDVAPGIDLLVTPPGGASFVDFAPSPIPAGFFDPGSDPFSGLMALQGQPLDGLSPLGPTDTIVRRDATAILPGPNSSTIIPIEIVALSLVSSNPIKVTYGGGGSAESWNVKVCLSSASPQTQGTMTVSTFSPGGCPCPEGGAFSSTLPVLPRFVFTRTVPTPATRVLDFGTAGRPAISFQTPFAHWFATDPGLGLVTVPSGLTVDHDCDSGTPAVGPLPASGGFFVGVRAVRCDSTRCDPPSAHVIRLSNSSAPSAAYAYFPAHACVADADADGICDDFDNCVADANPLQSDADDDGVGDLCDNCPPRANPCQEDLDHNGIGDACQVTGVEPGPSATRLALEGPAPNPTTGLVQYVIVLPRPMEVAVKLYDVAGRHLGDLFHGTLAAGRHPFTWNARSGSPSYRSGVYFLELVADGKRQARRLLLAR